MKYTEHRPSIKQWAEDDRPREKMESKGRSALSNAELLAILIGSGTRRSSAVEVCRDLLSKSSHKLETLARMSISEMTSVHGVGKARAITIMAALELGRRQRLENASTTKAITSSQDAFAILSPVLDHLGHEEFHVLLLNRANTVIKRIRISQGGVNGTVVDSRLIFKPAIDMLASGLILAHNHPSGKVKPSQSDIHLTKKLKEAGKVLDINILDHLIIGHKTYYSFADEGII